MSHANLLHSIFPNVLPKLKYLGSLQSVVTVSDDFAGVNSIGNVEKLLKV